MVPVTTGVEEDADIQHARGTDPESRIPVDLDVRGQSAYNADAIDTTVLEIRNDLSRKVDECIHGVTTVGLRNHSDSATIPFP